MNKNKLITPEGTKDYLFEEAIIRKSVQDRLRKLFDTNCFFEVVTPNVEFLDVFNANGYSMPSEFMYKLVDYKGRLIAVRPDSTMPIARLVATRLKNEQLPLRLYYNQSVNSLNKSMSGRSDEIMQAGIEL
ncbi:MAG: ATP phosphoribosyltransferase regulatory subunit, partial [Oscillospiraceae bacterium]